MTEPHVDSTIAQDLREMEDALEARGIVTGEEIDTVIDRWLETSDVPDGARVVARAWSDPGFKARLLADGNAAIGELGYSMAHGARAPTLRVVENTSDVHNVIVCTLCSCYPIALLGPSPSWYKSDAYRSRVVREPRVVLRELGVDLPEGVQIRVWDANAETRYLVVPLTPAEGEQQTEEALSRLVTRRGMIGTAAR
jgi:nitrile hydratase subunit alpha